MFDREDLRYEALPLPDRFERSDAQMQAEAEGSATTSGDGTRSATSPTGRCRRR